MTERRLGRDTSGPSLCVSSVAPAEFVRSGLAQPLADKDALCHRMLLGLVPVPPPPRGRAGAPRWRCLGLVARAEAALSGGHGRWRQGSCEDPGGMNTPRQPALFLATIRKPPC